jgi:hypothetical protein
MTFNADREEVEAGEAVTFRVQAKFTPGYPANLVNDEVCDPPVSFEICFK